MTSCEWTVQTPHGLRVLHASNPVAALGFALEADGHSDKIQRMTLHTERSGMLRAWDIQSGAQFLVQRTPAAAAK